MTKTRRVSARESTPEPSKGPRQARGRFVSRSIATSEQLGSVSLLADYLFRSCIPHLDVTGRMTGNPGLIKAAVAPLRDEIHSGVIPELLRELAESVDHAGIPLVFWYEISGAKVLEFPGFTNHQTGLREKREAPSKFPSRNGMEKLLHIAGPTPEHLRQNVGARTAQDEVEVEVEVEDEVVKSESRARTADQHRAESPPVGAPDRPHGTHRTAPTVAATSALLASLELLASDTHFPAIHEFLRRREYRTWTGWIREMLKLVGPGSQFTAEDLASVCNDDAALTEPIESPYGLRVFLGTRRRERLSASSQPSPANGANSGNGARTMPTKRLELGEATYAAALAALDDIDDAPPESAEENP